MSFEVKANDSLPAPVACLYQTLFLDLLEEGDEFITIMRKLCITFGLLYSPFSIAAAGWWLSVILSGPGHSHHLRAITTATTFAFAVALLVFIPSYIYCRCTKSAPNALINVWLFCTAGFFGTIALGVPYYPGITAVIAVLVLTILCIEDKCTKWMHIFWCSVWWLLLTYSDTQRGALADGTMKGGMMMHGGMMMTTTTTTMSPMMMMHHTAAASSSSKGWPTLFLPNAHYGSPVEMLLLTLLGYVIVFFVVLCLIVQALEYRSSVTASREGCHLSKKIAKLTDKYDTDGMRALLAKAKEEGVVDPGLVAGFEIVASNLEAYRPHLPNWLIASPEEAELRGGISKDGDEATSGTDSDAEHHGDGNSAKGYRHRRKSKSTTSSGGDKDKAVPRKSSAVNVDMSGEDVSSEDDSAGVSNNSSLVRKRSWEEGHTPYTRENAVHDHTKKLVSGAVRTVVYCSLEYVLVAPPTGTDPGTDYHTPRGAGSGVGGTASRDPSSLSVDTTAAAPHSVQDDTGTAGSGTGSHQSLGGDAVQWSSSMTQLGVAMPAAAVADMVDTVLNGDPTAARTAEELYHALVDAASTAANRNHGALHGLVNNQLTVSFNAATPCSQPELKACRFIAALLKDPVVGSRFRLTGYVTSCKARCQLAGKKTTTLTMDFGAHHRACCSKVLSHLARQYGSIFMCSETASAVSFEFETRVVAATVASNTQDTITTAGRVREICEFVREKCGSGDEWMYELGVSDKMPAPNEQVTTAFRYCLDGKFRACCEMLQQLVSTHPEVARAPTVVALRRRAEELRESNRPALEMLIPC